MILVHFTVSVDLRGCIDSEELEEGGDLGSLSVEYQFEETNWLYEQHLSLFEYDLLSFCTVSDSGTTLCESNIYLPTLWNQVEVTYYPSADDVGAGNVSFDINTFDDLFFNQNNYFYMEASIPDNSPVNVGTLWLPLGYGHINFNNGVEYLWQSFQFTTIDPQVLDIGHVTAPVEVKVYEPDNFPNLVTGEQVQFTQWGVTSDETFADIVNGIATANLNVGQIAAQVNLPTSNYSFWGTLNNNSPVAIDLFSDEECLISGQVFDERGQPLANQPLDIYMDTNNDWANQQLNSDAFGNFSFVMKPGQVWVSRADQENNFYIERNLNVRNCRPAGLPFKEINWDVQLSDTNFLNSPPFNDF